MLRRWAKQWLWQKIAQTITDFSAQSQTLAIKITDFGAKRVCSCLRSWKDLEVPNQLPTLRNMNQVEECDLEATQKVLQPREKI